MAQVADDPLPGVDPNLNDPDHPRRVQQRADITSGEVPDQAYAHAGWVDYTTDATPGTGAAMPQPGRPPKPDAPVRHRPAPSDRSATVADPPAPSGGRATEVTKGSDDGAAAAEAIRHITGARTVPPAIVRDFNKPVATHPIPKGRSK